MVQKIVNEVVVEDCDYSINSAELEVAVSRYSGDCESVSAVLLTSNSITQSRHGLGAQLESVYLALGLGASEDRNILLCDPLTGLVAYPSFEEHLVRHLPSLAAQTLHLAIGDVDDLRSYVTSRRCDDPMMFGHLAGNSCMRLIGSVVRKWSSELGAWPVLICGTFGGDEVIVAGSGLSYTNFCNEVSVLAERIRDGAPRPCSFAYGTLGPASISADDAELAYRSFVSRIDRALFDLKAECKSIGRALAGELIDVGFCRLS